MNNKYLKIAGLAVILCLVGVMGVKIISKENVMGDRTENWPVIDFEGGGRWESGYFYSGGEKMELLFDGSSRCIPRSECPLVYDEGKELNVKGIRTGGNLKVMELVEL